MVDAPVKLTQLQRDINDKLRADAVAAAKDAQADLLIAVGGGSVLVSVRAVAIRSSSTPRAGSTRA